jgi:hypothetical protein
VTMEVVNNSETSINFYESACFNIPEDCHLKKKSIRFVMCIGLGSESSASSRVVCVVMCHCCIKASQLVINHRALKFSKKQAAWSNVLYIEA